jgi:hypothetical protein
VKYEEIAVYILKEDLLLRFVLHVSSLVDLTDYHDLLQKIGRLSD